MSCLSSVIANRQLVLFCARLLAQCIMAWSTPHIAMDEFESKCIHAINDTGSQSIARDQRQVMLSGSGNRPGGLC
jgi:hypothetical protein